PSVRSKTWRPTTVAPISRQYRSVWSREAGDTFSTPLSSSGTSPLVSQSKTGPGWSSSAMNPSTDTEAYKTTLPMRPSSAFGRPMLASPGRSTGLRSPLRDRPGEQLVQGSGGQADDPVGAAVVQV